MEFFIVKFLLLQWTESTEQPQSPGGGLYMGSGVILQSIILMTKSLHHVLVEFCGCDWPYPRLG